MYNYQTFLREKNLSKHCSAIRKQYKQAEIKRQHSIPNLAHSHQKRVEGFILSAIDKPIPVTQYRNQPPCFRQTSSDGFLANKGFYIRRESQSQRIESSLKSNSELDHVPFHNASNHKFRDSPADSGLRYKPLTQSLRLREFFDKQELNYLPNFTPKKDKLVKKALKGERIDITVLNRSINKTLLPILHSKTYFKSVSSLYTEIPAANWPQNLGAPDQGGEDVEIDPRRTVKPKDHMSRKQNSKQALIKCNMLPIRA